MNTVIQNPSVTEKQRKSSIADSQLDHDDFENKWYAPNIQMVRSMVAGAFRSQRICDVEARESAETLIWDVYMKHGDQGFSPEVIRAFLITWTSRRINDELRRRYSDKGRLKLNGISIAEVSEKVFSTTDEVVDDDPDQERVMRHLKNLVQGMRDPQRELFNAIYNGPDQDDLGNESAAARTLGVAKSTLHARHKPLRERLQLSLIDAARTDRRLEDAMLTIGLK
jgi:DNA-directed RNA polymerase specialized sigma24 family protein